MVDRIVKINTFKAMNIEDLKRLIALIKGDPKMLENPLITPRNKRIFEDRHGINDGVSKTLEEVGKIYGVTRERVRQIETKVLDIVALTLDATLDNNND